MGLFVSKLGNFGPLKLGMDPSREISKLNSTQHISEVKDENDSQNSLPSSPKNKQALNSYQKNLKPKEEIEFHHLLLNIHARDILNDKIVYLYEKDSLSDVAKIFKDHSFRHIPIQNEIGQITGIISDRDLLEHTGKSPYTPITDIMTKEVFFAREDALLQDIARLMFYKNISCVPITNNHFKIIGIITSSDILKFLMNLGSIDLRK